MSPVSTPDPVQASAPDIARRVALIVAGLAALVAYRFLRDPRFKTLIVPLWTRLTRAAGRFERLMLRVAANRVRKPRPARAHRKVPDTVRPSAAALPAGHGWLIRAIPYEAAAYASQLEALLAEPATADLLAACPQAGRILGPLGRMLGLAAFARKRTPRQRRTPEASCRVARRRALLPPLHPEDPTYRPSAKWPRGPWPAARRPAPHWAAARQRQATPA